MAEVECLAHGNHSVHGRSCYHHSYLCFSLSPSLFLSLSLMSLSPFPLPSLPSLPLWLSFDLRAMLAALRPGSCGQEPHLPLPRAGPSEEEQRESFISHFLLWESESVETQLEPAPLGPNSLGLGSLSLP